MHTDSNLSMKSLQPPWKRQDLSVNQYLDPLIRVPAPPLHPPDHHLQMVPTGTLGRKAQVGVVGAQGLTIGVARILGRKETAAAEKVAGSCEDMYGLFTLHSHSDMTCTFVVNWVVLSRFLFLH